MRRGAAALFPAVLLLATAVAEPDAVLTLDPPSPKAGSPVEIEVAFASAGAFRDVRLRETTARASLTEGTPDLHVHLPAKGLATLHVRVPGASAIANVTGALTDGTRIIPGQPSPVGDAGAFVVPVVFPSAGAWRLNVATDAGSREAVVEVPESPGLVAVSRRPDGSALVAVREAPAQFHVGAETLAIAAYSTGDFRVYVPLEGASAVASALDTGAGRRVGDVALAPAGPGRYAGPFEIPASSTWEVRVNVSHPDYPTTRLLAAGPVSRLPVESDFMPVDDRVSRASATLGFGTYAVLAHGAEVDAAWMFDVAPAAKPYVSLRGPAQGEPGVPFDLTVAVASPDGSPLSGAADVEAVARDASGTEWARSVLAPVGPAYRWSGLVLPEKGVYSIHVSSPTLGVAPGEVDPARLDVGPPPDTTRNDPPPPPAEPGVSPFFLLVAALFAVGVAGLAVAALRKR